MKIEIRNDQVLIEGYVTVTDRESRVLASPRGKFIEKVRPKTFEKALSNADDVKILFNHNEQRQLGSIKQGNLELFEDNIGLKAIATISDEEVITKARNSELRGWSFGFVDKKPTWEDAENGIQRRTLEDIDLLEVSILDRTPAYVATSIELRDENEVITEQRSEEFTAEITDLTVHIDADEQEEREFDYTIYEKQLEILKLK